MSKPSLPVIAISDKGKRKASITVSKTRYASRKNVEIVQKSAAPKIRLNNQCAENTWCDLVNQVKHLSQEENKSRHELCSVFAMMGVPAMIIWVGMFMLEVMTKMAMNMSR